MFQRLKPPPPAVTVGVNSYSHFFFAARSRPVGATVARSFAPPDLNFYAGVSGRGQESKF